MKVPIAGGNLVGAIRITEIGDRRELYATCPCSAKHGVCIKTRTANAGRRKGQGRPLGYLGAWLQAAARGDMATKADHMKFMPSLAERRMARAAIARLPEAQRFFDFERSRGEDEASEPEEIV